MYSGLDGKDVVEENLRQICIWRQIKNREMHDRQDLSEVKWWEYTQLYNSLCYGETHNATALRACSYKQMGQVGIDASSSAADSVEQCIAASGGFADDADNTIMAAELKQRQDMTILNLPTVVVNNNVERGAVTPPNVLNMICQGFRHEDRPAICNEEYCWKGWDVCGKCGGDNSTCSGCDGIPQSGKVRATGIRHAAELPGGPVCCVCRKLCGRLTALCMFSFLRLLLHAALCLHARTLRRSTLAASAAAMAALTNAECASRPARLIVIKVREPPASTRDGIARRTCLLLLSPALWSSSNCPFSLLCLRRPSCLLSACAGCDGKANSGKTKDACGVCGGDGSFDLCGNCFSASNPARDKACAGCDGYVGVVLFGCTGYRAFVVVVVVACHPWYA